MSNVEATLQIVVESGCTCPPYHPPFLAPPPAGWKAYLRCDGSRYYHNETERVSCDIASDHVSADKVNSILGSAVQVRRGHCKDVDIHIGSLGAEGSASDILHIYHDIRMAQKCAGHPGPRVTNNGPAPVSSELMHPAASLLNSSSGYSTTTGYVTAASSMSPSLSSTVNGTIINDGSTADTMSAEPLQHSPAPGPALFSGSSNTTVFVSAASFTPISPSSAATRTGTPVQCTRVPRKQRDEELLYWHYVRHHPNHVDLGDSRQSVHELLTWCRDERALCSDADVPFSQDESETFLKYLDGYDERHGKNLVRQNCLVAALMERVVNWRHHRKEKPTPRPSISPSQHEISRRETVEKPEDSWLINLLYFFFVMVLFLGQPHTYRRRLGRIERFEPSHAIDTLHWQAFIGAFVTEWEHANILATVMISATVGFLAVPGLDDISRILGIISVLDAICSGLIGMVYVWHHGPRIKTTAALGRLYIKHGSHFFGMHSPVLFACTLAIPVVLLWWSFLSFVGAVLVYAFRGQQVDAMGQMVNFSITTKFTSLVAFIFGVGSGAAGYVVMWQVWKPISEPWARLGSDPEDRSGRAKKGQSSTSQSGSPVQDEADHDRYASYFSIPPRRK